MSAPRMLAAEQPLSEGGAAFSFAVISLVVQGGTTVRVNVLVSRASFLVRVAVSITSVLASSGRVTVPVIGSESRGGGG